MTATITKEQIKAIHALLPEELRNDADAKADFLSQFIGVAEKSSTKDLTFDLANDVIRALGGKSHSYDHWAIFDRNNDQHRYILSLMIQMGWSHYEIHLGRQVADMKHLSEFLKSDKSPCKKRLMEMNIIETSRVIRALEGILNHQLNKV